MHFFINGYGRFVSSLQNRLVVKENRTIIKEVSFDKIEAIYLDCKGLTMSSSFFQKCEEKRIPVFLMKGDKPLACFSYFEQNDMYLLKKQLNFPKEKRIEFAKQIIGAKITNQLKAIQLLKKTGLVSEEDFNKLNILHQDISEELTTCFDRNQIFSCEARFANRYWQTLASIIGVNYGFRGREGKGAKDAFNCALNYGYAILKSNIYYAILKTSLSPYFGLLHSEKKARVSLVYDLMEMFRPLVDKTLLSLFTKKNFDNEDFDNYSGILTFEGRKKISVKITDLFNKEFLYLTRQFKLKDIFSKVCFSLRDCILYDSGIIRVFIWR